VVVAVMAARASLTEICKEADRKFFADQAIQLRVAKAGGAPQKNNNPVS
jgi:hypothetical protein